MPDDPTPPRKHYKFKTAEFASINEVPTDRPLTEAQPKPDPGIVPTTKVYAMPCSLRETVPIHRVTPDKA